MNNYWFKFGLTAATTTVAYCWWKERTQLSITNHLEPTTVLPESVVSVLDVVGFEPPSSDVVADVEIPVVGPAELPSPIVAVVEVVHPSVASLELPISDIDVQVFEKFQDKHGTYSRRQLLLRIKERRRLGFKDSFTVSLRYFTEIGYLFLVFKYVGKVCEAAMVTEETDVIPCTIIWLKVVFSGVILGASVTYMGLGE